MRDREQLTAAIVEILNQHAGPDQAITMADLFCQAERAFIIPARKYDMTRIIRSIVEQLRREGHAIGIAPGGYFLATSPEQLAGTIATFHTRALSSLRQERSLKRCSNADLLSQYELELETER